MGLTEVVSGSGTVGFAQVGFVISLVVFSLILVWALTRPKAALLAEARSVLSDGLEVERGNHAKESSYGQQ